MSVKGRGADLFFGDGANERTNERPNDRTAGPSDAAPSEPSSERTNERTAAAGARSARRNPSGRQERPNERTNERSGVEPLEPLSMVQRVRHSFDVRRDQLLDLTGIQIDAFRRTGRKPTMGELVQEALDEYIRARRQRAGRSTD
ncbi:MAG TPA: hypothetical protein VG370_22440 [Chloroflexota bacterium]|nr:hypothetical protein [Chloroflexota bacterium]